MRIQPLPYAPDDDLERQRMLARNAGGPLAPMPDPYADPDGDADLAAESPAEDMAERPAPAPVAAPVAAAPLRRPAPQMADRAAPVAPRAYKPTFGDYLSNALSGLTGVENGVSGNERRFNAEQEAQRAEQERQDQFAQSDMTARNQYANQQYTDAQALEAQTYQRGRDAKTDEWNQGAPDRASAAQAAKDAKEQAKADEKFRRDYYMKHGRLPPTDLSAVRVAGKGGGGGSNAATLIAEATRTNNSDALFAALPNMSRKEQADANRAIERIESGKRSTERGAIAADATERRAAREDRRLATAEADAFATKANTALSTLRLINEFQAANPPGKPIEGIGMVQGRTPDLAASEKALNNRSNLRLLKETWSRAQSGAAISITENENFAIQSGTSETATDDQIRIAQAALKRVLERHIKSLSVGREESAQGVLDASGIKSMRVYTPPEERINTAPRVEGLGGATSRAPAPDDDEWEDI